MARKKEEEKIASGVHIHVNLIDRMVDFMDLEEDYNDISVRGTQRRGQKYHCNPTLSP